jgi:cell wall-associated NlpC family hydrolase
MAALVTSAATAMAGPSAGDEGSVSGLGTRPAVIDAASATTVTAAAHLDADPRVATVVAWAWNEAASGAQYAATNPGRLGTPWDGTPKRSIHSDRIYDFPPGTITYDCSGLWVVGFRQVGVDLAAMGAGWTGGMLAALPHVALEELRVGDLLISGDSVDDPSHVTMYVGDDSYFHAGSCPGGLGLCERRGIDWNRVIGIVRVPLG